MRLPDMLQVAQALGVGITSMQAGDLPHETDMKLTRLAGGM